jgi:hypothetical protein
MTSFLIILIAIWTFPILTLILVRLTRKNTRLEKRLIKIALGITFLTIFGLIFNVSSTIKELDWVLVTSIYFSICLILWTVYYFTNKTVKILAVISMFFVFGSGYLSGSIGIIGVGFVVGAYDTSYEKSLGDGLIYKETPIGNAVADYRGKKVEIYKTIKWLPIIEWRILHREYYNLITYGETLNVDYRPKIKTIYLGTSENLGKDHKLETWGDTLVLSHNNK